MKIELSTHSPETLLYFFNQQTGKIQNDIWDEISDGLWQDFSIDSFIYNNSLPADDLEKGKPLFSGFQQLVAGTYWNTEKNEVSQKLYFPRKVDGSLTHLLECTEKYINSLNAKRIGVHLSGGFDSSLVMCLMNELNIPFVPIGLKSETFEFRTERIVQDIMLERGEDGCLIDIEEHPHFSNLDKIPAHQIPDCDIKSFSGSTAIAEEFKKRGCDVVISGLGGDSLFVESIKNIKNISFNIENEFLNPTEFDRLYKPRGIRLLSFFSHPSIIDTICSAREGQSTDYLKLWARNWAKDIIPIELSKWSYCADFFGLSMWGLEKAKPMIKILMEEAYDLSNNSLFSPKGIKFFLSQDVYSFEYKEYIKFCGLISIASWYHSLFNNG